MNNVSDNTLVKGRKFSLTIHFHKYHISLLLRASFPATRGGIFSWWPLVGSCARVIAGVTPPQEVDQAWPGAVRKKRRFGK